MRKSTHTAEYRLLRQSLTAMRDAAGLSQRELARRLDVPHTWVAKIESGERRIDLVEYAWFCDQCGLDPVTAAKEVLAAATARRSPQSKGGRR